MNKVILIGRMVKKAEYKDNGELKVARFSLAVDKRNKDKTCDFIDCVAFDKLAEFVFNYFDKGNRLALTGRISQSKYTTQNGENRYKFEIVADDIEFVENKGDNKATTETQEKKPVKEMVETDDEVMPF